MFSLEKNGFRGNLVITVIVQKADKNKLTAKNILEKRSNTGNNIPTLFQWKLYKSHTNI